MGTKDKRIDAYIAKSADFAKPILTHIRATVHAACPEVEETLKWSSPFFMYGGSPLCMMAAFKAHCGFRFWKGGLVMGDDAGAFAHVTKVSELPSKSALAAYVKKAMALKDEGVMAPKRTVKPKKPLPVPSDLSAALKTNTKARATFGNFPPSHQREYVEWITGAKTDATRQRRLGQALEWMAEGKSRHWKYK
jgi:uncharacterized protein YdeI (YjbR/CyaY-like superfamily)